LSCSFLDREIRRTERGREREERDKEGVRAGLRGGGKENGGMKAISCLRLEVSDSVKMSEKAFKTHLHFTLVLLQYAIISSAVPPLPRYM
jgi:hypothetical protein